MSNQTLPVKFAECVRFTIPEFHTRPAVMLDLSKVHEGEKRLVEARIVNSATYSDLEYSFNEGYRETKKNLSIVMYEILQTEKRLREVKSEFLLDKYPNFLKETKIKDNAAIREAFLERQKVYTEAMDRKDMLTALTSLFEGKVKVFERVCSYMKKEMDLTIRSGIDSNKYMR